MTPLHIQKTVLALSAGNPGALEFLMLVLNWDNQAKAAVILSRIASLSSLRGTNLYVLYSDLCY